MDVADWPDPNNNLIYNKGEHRFKHSGRDDEARIVYKDNHAIGKCPKAFSQTDAEKLVRHGIPERRDRSPEVPCRIWNYHDGVIYAARCEDSKGYAWHGYPVAQEQDIPREILRKLKSRAQELGESDRIEIWLRQKW